MSLRKIASFTFSLSTLLLIGCACTYSNKTDCKKILKEIHTMSDTTILDFGDYDVMLPPLMYCPGEELRHIFAVPKNNMVGTNELDNAITLLEFETDKELAQQVVKKNFMEMVTGPFEFRFLPVWSDREIAYSQSKGFLLVNIPEKKVEIHTISPGMYTGEIGNIAVLDAASRTFVMEINPSAAGIGAYKKILKVIRFENNEFTVLSEHSAGIKAPDYSEPWFVYEKKIFIYNQSATKLEVYDESFKTTTHPLAEAFNNDNRMFRRMQEIIIHPFLPFALIVEIGKEPDISKFELLPPDQKIKALTPIYDEISRRTLYLFRWPVNDEKQKFLPLISLAGSIWNTYNPANNYSNFNFSPDGKWCVFRDHTGDDQNPVFVAVPIDEKNPLYVGKPVKLGKVLREDASGPKGTAWTTNPTAFVMCDGQLIYRWNLDKYKQSIKVKMPPGSPDPFVQTRK
jgi:hypothetical protein